MVGLLAPTSSPDAAVIFEKTDLRIGSASSVNAQTVELDFNSDGNIDWVLRTSFSGVFSRVFVSAPSTTLFVYRTPINGLTNELAPLATETFIGSILGNEDFRFLNTVDAFSASLASAGGDSESTGYYGPFSGNDAFLGFRFDAEDGPHFGYALLRNVDESGTVITSYAWEPEPWKGIIAGAIPEPLSTSLLALGVLTFGFRRRRPRL